MTAATFTAERHAGQITMEGNLWSDTFPVVEADRRLEFYNRMHAKYPGQAYGQAANALKTAMKDAA
tara:strand:+ start:846 stop:1043 length:198 start_codon:yes stop_codon:yes gene_type:complete